MGHIAGANSGNINAAYEVFVEYKAPTCTEEGLETKECKLCDESKETILEKSYLSVNKKYKNKIIK